MNVAKLIAALQHFDLDAEVHFSYNYGDYWRTTVAPVANNVELMRVTYSSYHSMLKLVDEDDTRFNEATEVVVIS